MCVCVCVCVCVYVCVSIDSHLTVKGTDAYFVNIRNKWSDCTQGRASTPTPVYSTSVCPEIRYRSSS